MGTEGGCCFHHMVAGWVDGKGKEGGCYCNSNLKNVGVDPIVNVGWVGQGKTVGKAVRSVADGSFGHTVVDDNLDLGRAVGSVVRVDGCCTLG